ncbi:MAG: 3-phosphoshikimate 1-carboxyvinyltransferase [Nitriliruptoraceae bacterium]|nr:3-phosphoshikimate 1-carboxyvinyltransferase [Nitriliruptoraceae bacterium]
MPEPSPHARTIEPLTAPPDAVVTIPGSKSLTNRALVAAALAEGTSHLQGVLFADDTDAMLDCLQRLGVHLDVDRSAARVTVHGLAGPPQVTEADLDVRLSGTTARFVAPLLAAASGRFRLDGAPPFRARPMGPVLEAMRALGAEVVFERQEEHLPAVVTSRGAAGGRVTVRGDRSSQFLSGLLLVAPVLPHGLTIEVTTPLVSEPYVTLTLDVMRAFGVEVDRVDPRTFVVRPARYTSTTYEVEPDASAARYPLAAAAMTGGRVRVPGLTPAARQGDAGFAHVLGRMGAEVVVDDDGTEVRGTGRLDGLEVDLGPMSDTAQTLAVVATLASGPTSVRGIGFIRAKETDRIAAVVTELQRCGLTAREDPDGFTIEPGTPRPTSIETYDDHRMAMSFALLGLVHPGITILDPGCVAKTFPDYFTMLERLRPPGDVAGPR